MSHSLSVRRSSFTDSMVPRRRSFSDGDVASRLMRQNHSLARENALLKEKCRILDIKVHSLERTDPNIYTNKVQVLVESVKPIMRDLELFKQKVTQFQTMIHQKMNELWTVEPQTSQKTKEFPKLDIADQEKYRQSAGERLKEMANNWNLSTIPEASRSRFSTNSFTGMSYRASSFASPGTGAFKDDDSLFDSEQPSSSTKASSRISLIPRFSGSKTSSSVPSKDVEDCNGGITSAAGDQPISCGSQENERFIENNIVSSTSDNVDELSNFPGEGELIKQPKGRAKAASTKKTVAQKKPKKVVENPGRKKKTVQSAAAAGAASGDESVVPFPPLPTCDPDLEGFDALMAQTVKKLRPRRKAINYKES